ncbi:MAG: ABC transporter substrate-binding protein [Actinomycetes bacterium]
MSTRSTSSLATRRFAGLAIASTLAALTLAGCSSDSSGTATDTGAAGGASSAAPAGSGSAPASGAASSGGSDLAAMVPDSVKSDGVITIGTDSTYAPSEFLDTDGKTITGFDIDLFNEVAKKLGLKANFQTAPFDAIITGVNSGKYELGVSSFTVNAEREKAANMVSYFNAGTQWAAKKGSTITPDTACGKNVAVQKGTVQVDDIQARSKKCTDAGKPAINIDQYAGQDQATASVVSGKDDAMLADSPVAAYAVKQTNGQLQLIGEVYDAAPYGYVVKKDQLDFAKAISEAVNELIQDGTYQQVLEKWGVQAGAIKNSEVNPSAS